MNLSFDACFTLHGRTQSSAAEGRAVCTELLACDVSGATTEGSIYACVHKLSIQNHSSVRVIEIIANKITSDLIASHLFLPLVEREFTHDIEKMKMTKSNAQDRLTSSSADAPGVLRYFPVEG
jgi:hypothetical protein